MKRLLLISLLLSCMMAANADKLLQALYPREVLEKSIVTPGQFTPVPKSSSPFWKSTLGEPMVNSYVENARPYLGKAWAPIPAELFGEFKKNGNRTNFEKRSFDLRHQMAVMVMAECVEGKGTFIDDIIRGLHYFLSETWWGIPAHYPKAQPERDLQEVDLFNAETANLLAWTCYMLENQIKQKDGSICQTIKKEIQRRMLDPARKYSYTWKLKSWNHNPWTCANWLSCILFCDDNRKQQIDDLCQVLKALDVFIDGYPEDGGCDEGPMYWDRAAASLFECMQLLSLASNGRVALPHTDKIKAMGAYIYRLYVGEERYVTFSACPLHIVPNINVLFPFGYEIGDPVITQYAAHIAKQRKFFEKPAQLFNRTGNYPSVSRELCFLRLLPQFRQAKAAEPKTDGCWLPGVEVFAARSGSNSKQALYVAAKGGNNGENHNHNDIGNFVVYAGIEPLFIDLGNDTYTAKTFSKERYTLMNTRSAFHNVPLINGQEQQAGENFRSKAIKCKQGLNSKKFSIDVAHAYPAAAQVKKWKRDIELKDEQLFVTENYQLSDARKPTQLMFMSKYAPKIDKGGSIAFKLPNGTYELSYSPDQMKAEVESFDISATAMKSSWGNKVYRTKLTVISTKKKNKITYVVKMRNEK